MRDSLADEGRPKRPPLVSCVPSMNTDLEVRVPWGVARNAPSEPQGDNHEEVAEKKLHRRLRAVILKQGKRGRRPNGNCDSGAFLTVCPGGGDPRAPLVGYAVPISARTW